MQPHEIRWGTEIALYVVLKVLQFVELKESAQGNERVHRIEATGEGKGRLAVSGTLICRIPSQTIGKTKRNDSADIPRLIMPT